MSTIVFGLLAFAALATAVDCAYGQFNYPARLASLRPLRVLLPRDHDIFRVSFTAGWTAAHSVDLVFRKALDPETKALLKRVSAMAGAQGRPSFDFTWKVFEGSVEVGRGPQLEPFSQTYGEHHRDLSFGRFPARAAHTYVLEVRRGPAAEPLSRAAPELEIHVNEASPSIGLEIEREFGGAAVLIFGVVGLALLWCAVASLKPRNRNTYGQT